MPIREAARNNSNGMHVLVEGTLANCTMGEMAQAMADVYGRYTAGTECYFFQFWFLT